MKETLIEQRERERREDIEANAPQFPRGYVELQGIGLYRDGDEPKDFWTKLKHTFQFWKWDYTK